MFNPYRVNVRLGDQSKERCDSHYSIRPQRDIPDSCCSVLLYQEIRVYLFAIENMLHFVELPTASAFWRSREIIIKQEMLRGCRG